MGWRCWVLKFSSKLYKSLEAEEQGDDLEKPDNYDVHTVRADHYEALTGGDDCSEALAGEDDHYEALTGEDDHDHSEAHIGVDDQYKAPTDKKPEFADEEKTWEETMKA